ncbi:hypothetical protein G3T14_22705 [Methylobacterium sp. BTF04]|uniref:hypothetical protein n=1 Tax=Methylobacterium sp. BTF04 TaxID=2708300 RepID=UPI0013D5D5FF|nr:hypothetical protein [Methylobacterium sp. BTF04]NEU14871.1 hypothetical protein [Methylobacterium sp. BTF04]
MAFHYLPKSATSKNVVLTNQLNLYREIRTFLLDRGFRLRPACANAFLHEAARARLLASLRLESLARKRFGEDPNATAFPAAERPRRRTWDVLFDDYAAEKQLAERTKRSWKNNLLKLMVFAGVDHPADLVFDHVERFRDHLRASGTVSNHTIRFGYIGAARAFLNWCIARAHRSADNPAAAVIVFPEPRHVLREPGLSDEEALDVLAATLGPRAPNISDRTADARRWIPWLCAYTGARIDEIAQIRQEDVRQTKYNPLHPDPVWYIDLTPEAGHIKTGVFRHVPIHPDLVELGFLEFVGSREGRRLFVDPASVRSRDDLRGVTASTSNRLGRWIRTIVADPAVRPNHGWRHRFISLASTAKVDREKRDIITGHSSESRGARYGYRHPAELLDELMKMVSHLQWLRHLRPELVDDAVARRSDIRQPAVRSRRRKDADPIPSPAIPVGASGSSPGGVGSDRAAGKKTAGWRRSRTAGTRRSRGADADPSAAVSTPGRPPGDDEALGRGERSDRDRDAAAFTNRRVARGRPSAGRAPSVGPIPAVSSTSLQADQGGGIQDPSFGSNSSTKTMT